MMIVAESMRVKLLDLLDEGNFIAAELEDVGMQSILPYYFTTLGYDVVIYGAAGKGYAVLCWLKSKNIEPLCMVDGDIRKHGSKFFGVDVVHIGSLAEKIRGKKVYAIVCTGAWYNFEDKFMINDGLRSAGCMYVEPFLYRGSDARYWTIYYKTHKDDLIWLFDELCDEESKACLLEYIRCVICDKAYSREMLPTEEKYFAADVACWLGDECFVDCGAFEGDTIFNIVRSKRTFGKIYAIEADWDSLERAKKMSAILPSELTKKIEFHNAFLSGSGGQKNTLDVILKNQRVTLIKTDLEGNDLDALKGANEIIAEQIPVLAICVYHKKEDLIEIPAFIKKMSDDYSLYMRKYYPGATIYSKDEMILYAVPKRRCKK
jgi:hypothetical protein